MDNGPSSNLARTSDNLAVLLIHHGFRRELAGVGVGERCDRGRGEAPQARGGAARIEMEDEGEEEGESGEEERAMPSYACQTPLFLLTAGSF